jgi:hypothetical protein
MSALPEVQLVAIPWMPGAEAIVCVCVINRLKNRSYEGLKLQPHFM